MHLNTFQSPEFGPIGIVDSNETVFYRDKLIKQYIPAEKIDGNVQLVKTFAGDDGSIIDFCIQSKVGKGGSGPPRPLP